MERLSLQIPVSDREKTNGHYVIVMIQMRSGDIVGAISRAVDHLFGKIFEAVIRVPIDLTTEETGRGNIEVAVVIEVGERGKLCAVRCGVDQMMDKSVATVVFVPGDTITILSGRQ
jgi:RNase P/RNase MRP subunit POP5